MDDQDNVASGKAQEPAKWSDVDYCTINYLGHNLADSAIVNYWLNSNGRRSHLHDTEILEKIDALVVLAQKLRADMGVAS